MKPQKQSLNIYKVIQRPTEIKRTKEEGTEGLALAEEHGRATELCSMSTCKGERRGPEKRHQGGKGQGGNL